MNLYITVNFRMVLPTTSIEPVVERQSEKQKTSYFDFLCQQRRLEIRFDDKFTLHLLATYFSDDWNDAEWQGDVSCCAVPGNKRVK